jgi:hypothetical protein
MASQSMSDKGKKDVVQDWLKGLAVVCDAGIGKLVPRNKNCLNLYGDYVQ